MGQIWPLPHSHLLTTLTKEGLSPFFKAIMTLPPKPRLDLVSASVEKASAAAGQNPAFSWIKRLNDHYPSDIGVLAPLYLNLVTLQPGEAICLGAGQLHAYLDGVGIEIMANSDNVLRGGLTTKHVDVPELIQALDFTPQSPTILTPASSESTEYRYPSRAEEFELGVLRTKDDIRLAVEIESICILFCTQGSAVIEYPGQERPVSIKKGESVLIPAALESCTISGVATLFKASVKGPLDGARRTHRR
jgi:mannose-6-phosphate isomerase